MYPLDGLGEERTASNVVMMPVRGQDGPHVPRNVAEFGQCCGQQPSVIRLPRVDECKSLIFDQSITVIV